MTDHHDRPNVAQRRRVSRLRSELGISFLPPHVGSELRTVTSQVVEQVEARLARLLPAGPTLSPGGQRLLLAATARAVDEFAHIVEDRPPGPPAVEAMLVELVHVEGPERCLAALRTALKTVREVMGGVWAQLPHGRAYAPQLELALSKYADRLCARTMKAPRRPKAAAPGELKPDDAPLPGLLALIANRWGTKPVQLYITVATLGGVEPTIPTGKPRRGGPPVPPELLRPVRLVTTDHVVMVTQHPLTPPRPSRTARRPIVVCAGPVSVSGVAVVYDTALLLLRLIGAGVASPPSPVVITPPNLGFLHPYPNESSVRKIGELLRPLAGQAVHRRAALARTMQLRLRTASTAVGLAKQLALHPQTVHNHLATLRGLFNHDLDFHTETLALQAAIDLVLPLWELELQETPTRPRPLNCCRQAEGAEATQREMKGTCQECPVTPEDLP